MNTNRQKPIKWFFTGLFSAVLLGSISAQQAQAEDRSASGGDSHQTTQTTSGSSNQQAVALRSGKSTMTPASSSASDPDADANKDFTSEVVNPGNQTSSASSAATTTTATAMASGGSSAASVASSGASSASSEASVGSSSSSVSPSDASSAASGGVNSNSGSDIETVAWSAGSPEELELIKSSAAADYQKTKDPQFIYSKTPTATTASIRFNFIDQTTGAPIVFDGALSSLVSLKNNHSVSDMVIYTDQQDPEKADTGDPSQYAVAIPGYSYVGNVAQDVPSDFKPGEQTVDLMYKPLSRIEVNYVDEADPSHVLWSYKIDSKSQFAGDDYKTDYFQMPFNGYTFDHVDGNATGKFGQLVNSATDLNPIVITYYYQKNADYKGQAGEPIGSAGGGLKLQKTPMADDLQTGDSINLTPNVNPGYTLIATTGIYQGAMPNHGEEATAVFVNNAPVTVNYADDGDGAILKTITLGKVDASAGVFPEGSYETSAQTIDGYQIDHVDGDTSGTFDPVNKQVTYYYHKSANLAVNTSNPATTSPVAAASSTTSTSTLAPAAKPTRTMGTAIVNFVDKNNHLIDAQIISARIGEYIKPLIAPSVSRQRKNGFQPIASEIQAISKFEEGIHQYYVGMQKTSSTSAFSQNTMPALDRLNQVAESNNQSHSDKNSNNASSNGQSNQLRAENAIQKANQMGGENRVPTNNYNRQISATYQDALEQLAQFYHSGGGGGGDGNNTFSSLGDYFVTLSGKINFGMIAK